jgi:hypothetical protein
LVWEIENDEGKATRLERFERRSRYSIERWSRGREYKRHG